MIRSGRILCVLVAAFAAPLSVRADQEAGASDDASAPRLVREIYVPHEVFRALARDRKDGVLMPLDEYRALVAAATAARPGDEPELPPLATAVLSADTQGIVTGRTVRLRTRLSVRVLHPGWVWCDLGIPNTPIGSVVVDGEPGWLVYERPSEKAAKRQATSRSGPFLLLRGVGEHLVELTHSLPTVESDAGSRVDGELVRAASGRIELEIPGRAAVTSPTGPLSAETTGDSTRVVLGVGTSSAFTLQWEVRQSASELGSLAAAEHRVAAFPHRGQLRIHWNSRVTVHRRPLDTLVFRNPGAASIFRVTGSLVDSWEPLDTGARVFLKEPVLGDVRIAFDALADAPGGSAEVRPPQLEEAYANHGVIGVLASARDALSIDTTDLVELAVDDFELNSTTLAAISGTSPPALERVFAFGSPDASLRATANVAPAIVSAHSSFVAQIAIGSVRIDGRTRILVREGKLYEIRLSLAEPWVVRRIARRASGGAASTALPHETTGAGAERGVTIELASGLGRGEWIDLEIQIEHAGFASDEPFERREVEFALPSPRGLAHQRTDFALLLPGSMDTETTALPGWRALTSDELDELGFSARGLGEKLAARTLALAVSTDSPDPRATIAIRQRSSRGEYQVVTHVLALERTLRVRADLRVVVVDRAIEELGLVLPNGGGANPVILANDIREITPADADGVRSVRFRRPWLGTRHLRVEYETESTSGSAVPIPVVALREDFGRQGFLVLQSHGAVEVQPSPGSGLESISFEDIPEFSAAWKVGRLLRAFRLRPQGDPGTFATIVHPQAPVLSRIASTLKLSTVIGRDGVSRTIAEILLGSPGTQYLDIELPPGSRALSVEVDGRPVRSVRQPDATASESIVSIPLPSRSHSAIKLVYERLAPAVDASSVARWGHRAWEELGPRLVDTPVGRTEWRLFVPPDFRFAIGDTNLLAKADRHARGVPGSFWDSFVLPLAMGRRVVWPLGSLPTDRRRFDDAGEVALAAVRALNDSSERQTAVLDVRSGGYVIEAEKLGGEPRIALEFWSRRWENAVRRAVTLFTIAIGLVLLRRVRGSGRRFVFLGAALVVATALPVALRWSSPLLALPIAEGIALLLALALAVLALDVARNLVVGFARRLRGSGASLSSLFVLTALGFSAGTPATAQDGVQPAPWDGVLIPYSGDAIPGESALNAFVPEERFRELWRMAHPEEALRPDDPNATPVPFVAGGVQYDLTVADRRVRIVGRSSLLVLTDEWVSIPLALSGLQIERVAVDGDPTGVIWSSGSPRLLVRGRGKHSLELELTGSVEQQLGSFRLRCGVAALPVALLTAHLPPGASVRTGGISHQGIVDSLETETRLELDLGRNGRVDLDWWFPGQKSAAGSRIESASYSRLTLGVAGIDVHRHETVSVTGQGVTELEYEIHGDWRITDLTADGLSEWSVDAGEGAEPRRLRLYFATPLEAIRFTVEGHATAEASTTLPTLELRDATRQEIYVGLTHSSRSRFLPESLSELEQISANEPGRVFGVEEASLPVRAYHGYGSGAGATLAIGAASTELAVSSQGIAIVHSDRLTAFVRARYSTARPGPLRYEVDVPAGWWIRSARSPALRRWEVRPAADGVQRLTVHFTRRAVAGTEVTWVAEQRFASLDAAAPLPDLRTSITGTTPAGTKDVVEWTFAADDAWQLSATGTDEWESTRVDGSAPWIELPSAVSYRFGYRTRRAVPPPTLGAVRRASRLSATSVSFVRIAEDYIYVNARLVLRVRFAPREMFHLRLPVGAELVSLDVRNQRSRAIADRDVRFSIQSTSAGEHTVDLTLRIARTGVQYPSIAPIEILDGDTVLEAVDAFVGVVQTASSLVGDRSAVGLSPVDAEAFPFVPQGVSPQSLRPAYRATGVNWNLVLQEQEIEQSEGLAAIVKLAEVHTAIGTDGIRRSEATYVLSNRRLQFLVVDLPPEATLWGVTLDGSPVSVGQSASSTTPGLTIEIPLEYVGSADLDLEIGVRYEEPQLTLGELPHSSLSLDAPSVRNVQVNETLWKIHFPEGTEVWQTGGNVRQVNESVQYAKKVENLLDQQSKILKVARESRSRKLRSQARRELARLDQELGDNIAELQTSFENEAGAPVVDEREFQQQRVDQSRLIRKAQAAQLEARATQDGAADEDESAVEQSFRDVSNFLQRGNWRGGKMNEAARAAVPQSTRQVDPARGAGADGEVYRGVHGYGFSSLDGPEATVNESVLGLAGGLPQLDASAHLGSVPGLEARPARGRETTLTFHRVGGDATVELAQRRPGTRAQLAAVAVLVVLLAGAVTRAVLVRRARRS